MASRGDLQRAAGRGGSQNCLKGAKVYLEGQLQTRKWTDKDGAEKYTTEVVVPRFNGTLTMLDGRSGGGGGGDAGGYDGGMDDGGGSAPAPTRGGKGGDLDDDIRLEPCDRASARSRRSVP